MSDAQTAAPAASPAPAPDAAPAAAPAPAAAAPAAEAPPAAPAAPAPAPAAAPKADEAPAGAPEAYGDFTVPEGVEMDATVMGEFGALAKSLNLPQDKAQALVDLGAKLTAGNSQALQAKVDTFYSDIGGTPDKWAEASKADKEFGGAKFDENLAVAKAAIEQFGTPELKAFLDKTKAGDHPEWIRFAHRVGKAISEDGFVAGRQGGGSKPTAQSFYANSNMNP